MVETQMGGEVMEEKPVCNSCSKQIESGDKHLVIKASKKEEKDTFLCAKCLDEVQTALDEETRNPNIPMSFVVGLGGAIVASLIWYFFVTLTEWQIGIIAILMGWLVGQGVVWGAGHKRGTSLRWISVTLTLIAIFFSEYLILNHFLHEAGVPINLTIGQFFEIYGAYLSEGAGFLDILFFGIALWQAYATPGPRKLQGEIVHKNVAHDSSPL